MDSLKVALLQLMPEGSEIKNLRKGFEYCNKAKALDADIALFPEMWNIGYQISEDPDRLRQDAISRDSEFVREFQSLAGELDMAIGITFLESCEPKPKNTVCIFDRHSKLCLVYSKVHTYDHGDEIRLSRGDEFPVNSLETKNGIVQIGAMICYDREFPETARILMLKGAEVILVPNACPMEINRLSQLRGRAYENMLGIATANYPYGNLNCTGHSSAFDGIAYRKGDTVSRNTLVIEAGEREGIYLADFPIEEMREYRRTSDQANSYRRPQLYKKITDATIKEPFVRNNYRP